MHTPPPPKKKRLTEMNRDEQKETDRHTYRRINPLVD